MATSIAKKKRPSVVKRDENSKKAAEYNRSVRSRVKTFVKHVRVAVAKGDLMAASSAFRLAMPELHKSARKGVYPLGSVSRRISRLHHSIKVLEAKNL